MDKALIFNNDGLPTLVSAEEIKNGLYGRYDCEFVDPEYEFKVMYVNGAKNHGRPHFRFYYSYEDYKRLFPDRADRYEIVANMRKYQESLWHRTWKESVSFFCEIEKCLKNPETNKWKFADAFNVVTNTCIEFQHSYIAFDFEERNAFYSQLGLNVIWLYDLPKATVRERKDGYYELLEDNARGFFRISEKPENLKMNLVYIQVKSGAIFRVTELLRPETSSELKSSIRMFKPSEIYTEEDFRKMLMTKQSQTVQSLSEIWNTSLKWIVVEDTTNGNKILINRDKKGNMFRSFSSGLIQYKYVTCYDRNGETLFSTKSSKDYSISYKKESAQIWKLIKSDCTDKPLSTSPDYNHSSQPEYQGKSV